MKRVVLVALLILAIAAPCLAGTSMTAFTDDSSSPTTTRYVVGYGGTTAYRWTIASILGTLSGTYQPLATNLTTWAGLGAPSANFQSMSVMSYASMLSALGAQSALSFLGNGSKVATTSASAPASNKCVEFDSTGNLVIAGSNAVCGSGGSGADANGYYLVNQSTNAPTHAINLGAGSTGLVFQTISGGVATMSVKSIGTDVQAYNANTAVGPGSSTANHVATFSGTDGKTLADGGTVLAAYSEPASNLPLCRTGAGTTGGCTNLTDTAYAAATNGTLTGPAFAAYASSGTTDQGTKNINIDGASYSDYTYSPLAGTAGVYTPVITSAPGAGVRYINLHLGGGTNGITTVTWTNVDAMGPALATSVTASKYNHYACIIPTSGHAKCSIIAEASTY